jgi:hypothetical protein
MPLFTFRTPVPTIANSMEAANRMGEGRSIGYDDLSSTALAGVEASGEEIVVDAGDTGTSKSSVSPILVDESSSAEANMATLLLPFSTLKRATLQPVQPLVRQVKSCGEKARELSNKKPEKERSSANTGRWNRVIV